MLKKTNHTGHGKEFIVGFSGWLVYSNMIFSMIALSMLAVPSIEHGFLLVFIGTWIPTAITLVALFRTKKFWLGTGILTAITLNSMIIASPFIFSLRVEWLFSIFRLMLLPFPSTLIFYIYAVIHMMSPPYENLGHLMDFYRIQ